mmetsp:Transcript_23542/g.39704  ORF Transcript_23542/g.39704 Transcript_23542/m.39704 type:complete len:94 (+) Transcript_23542:2714-2995(+)
MFIHTFNDHDFSASTSVSPLVCNCKPTSPISTEQSATDCSGLIFFYVYFAHLVPGMHSFSWISDPVPGRDLQKIEDQMLNRSASDASRHQSVH